MLANRISLIVPLILFLIVTAFISSLLISHIMYGDIAGWRPWTVFEAVKRHGFTAEIRDYLKYGAIFSLIIVGFFVIFFGNLFTDIKGSDSHGAAKFASDKEVKKMGFNDHFGIVVGRQNGKIVQSSSANYSVCLLAAPPRSGKGVGTIIPTLLSYPGSVLVYDVKGENFKETARHRSNNGHDVIAFAPWGLWDVVDNPSAQGAKCSHRFNPLQDIAQIKDLEDRNTELKTLATSFLSANTPTESSFLGNGIDVFVAVCAVAITLYEQHYDNNPDLKRRYASFKDVTDLLAPTADGHTITDTLIGLSQIEGIDPQTKKVLQSTGSMSQRIVDSYLSVLETCGLNVFRDPAVLRATSENDFDIRNLRKTPNSIYIVVPPDKKEQAAPIVRLFMQYVAKSLQKSLPDKETEPYPVLFMIDEFHTLGKVDAIIDACTVIPGYGGRICMVVQSVESLTDIYGRDRKAIILDNAQLQIYMGANNVESAEYISKALGQQTVMQRTISSKWLSNIADKNSSFSERAKPLMTPREIQQLDKNKVIALVQNNNPIYADKIWFFKDPLFKKLEKAQLTMSWPDVPTVKSGSVTDTADYLKIGDFNIIDLLVPEGGDMSPQGAAQVVQQLQTLTAPTLDATAMNQLEAAIQDFETATDIPQSTSLTADIKDLFERGVI